MIHAEHFSESVTEKANQAFAQAAIEVRRKAHQFQTPIVVWDHERQIIREIYVGDEMNDDSVGTTKNKSPNDAK